VAFSLLANKDADGNRHPILFGGVDGGTVNNGWTFRLTFAGVTLNPGCWNGFCTPSLGSSRVASGTVDGSYDVTDTPAAVSCGFAKQASPGGVTFNNYSGTVCGSLTGTSTPIVTAYLLLGGKNVNGNLGSQGYVLLFLGAASGLGSRGSLFFEQAFDICQFYDGMVLNNYQTSYGCKTLLEGGTDDVQGKDGTCTITRLACH
jgi:hypothetical protein